MLVSLWVALNLFSESIWGYYELVHGTEPPSPGIADFGYLASYAVALAAVLVTTLKSAGKTRMFETTLDAAMLTTGAAGLSWPLVFAPLLEVNHLGAELWVRLAYPVGDLLIIFAFASFFLGFVRGDRKRPRPYHMVLCLAFGFQIVADSAFLAMTASSRAYSPGTWLNPVWLMAFVTAGIAALMEIQTASDETASETQTGTAASECSDPVDSRFTWSSSYWGILVSSLGLPIIAGMLLMELWASGWKTNPSAEGLAYLMTIMVFMVLLRQYVTLTNNHRLNLDLNHTSIELREKVDHLADVNQKLEDLSRAAYALNTLRNTDEVARTGLELACTCHRAPGGWLTLVNSDGKEVISATYGCVDMRQPERLTVGEPQDKSGDIRTIPLEVRDERLGNLHLLNPPEPDHMADPPLMIVAAHMATAIDNVRRYEEALRLAEKDPLTGLLNRRGIHKRLATEMLNAQRNNAELSVITIDLDDFKMLNDTYGHPTGDAVLRYTAAAIASVLRHSDAAGRVGGDELLIVLPNTGSEGAVQAGLRLRDFLTTNPYIMPTGRPLFVRLSQGFATHPGDASSLEDLLETSDASLYRSKQSGGNTFATVSADRAPSAYQRAQPHRVMQA